MPRSPSSRWRFRASCIDAEDFLHADRAHSTTGRLTAQRGLRVAPTWRNCRRMPGSVLIAGVGTGLDLPLLPAQHHYVGLDLTSAMLTRACHAAPVWISTRRGDAQLPFATASFDHAVLHLILAVVPNPNACLAEMACRSLAAPSSSSTNFEARKPCIAATPRKPAGAPRGNTTGRDFRGCPGQPKACAWSTISRHLPRAGSA